jgi:hypothetical protein
MSKGAASYFSCFHIKENPLVPNEWVDWAGFRAILDIVKKIKYLNPTLSMKHWPSNPHVDYHALFCKSTFTAMHRTSTIYVLQWGTELFPLLLFRGKKKSLTKFQFWVYTTNSMAFSPQASYTDWATATVRQILVPTCGQCGGTPTAVNLSFLDWSHYFFFPVAPLLCSWVWVDPISDPLLLIKSGSAGNRPRDLWVCSHRGGWVYANIL